MKFLRDNFSYILLAFIAIVLIFVTVNLQMAILTRQSATAAPGQGILYTVRQRLAELILPPTDSSATTVQAPATQSPPPTNTPIVIVVQPTPLPATATATTVQPTATTLAVATRTPPNGLPTAAPLVIQQTATPTVLVVPVTATDAAPAPASAGGAVDFRLGYVEQNRDCVAATELMQLILERDFDLQITTVGFPNSAALFEKLAAKTETERVDLTFCYTDPADRSYLQQYFGFVIFVGSGYRQVGSQKFIIMSNAAVKSPIERGNPCLYRFLTKLNLDLVDWNSGDAATWYQNNSTLISTLVRCD